MIYVAKSPLNAAKPIYLFRWQDADGRQHTRRLTPDKEAWFLLERSRDKRESGAK